MADGFTVAKRRYTHPDLNDEPRSDPFAVADLALTNAISETVERYYPGHPWLIEVTHEQGIAMISIPLFMGMANKYVLHISALKTDPSMRGVIRACGEILERYRIPRQRFSRDHFVAALQDIPISRRGSHGLILS